MAKKKETSAEFIDRRFLRPRNSPVTGDMVQWVWRTYGIPPVWTITIMGAETALAHGDPKIGGVLVRHNNFGCIKYMGEKTRWGELSNGSVVVAGKRWYTWPDPWTGMAALGRYLKVGVGGKYLDLMKRSDYRGFTEIYYGKDVPGYERYHQNWMKIFRWAQAEAKKAGFSW